MSVVEASWGFPKVWKIEALATMAYNHRKAEEKTVYIPADSRPQFVRYIIKARLVVRFISEADWTLLGPDMTANPSRYLYLNQRPDHLYPKPPPPAPPLKERMRKMLRDIDPTHAGVCTFIVGPGRVKIHAHESIVGSMLAVPLLHVSMTEGASKEVFLPEACAEAFGAYVEYLYTQDLPQSTLRKHAAGLLAIAGQYLDPMLLFKCEDYLFRVVHVRAVPPMRHAPPPLTIRPLAHRRARRSTPTSSTCSPSPTATRPGTSRRRASTTCSSTDSICSRTRPSSTLSPG